MRLTALYVYPVKSARGLAVDAAEVGDRGFDGNRRFMLVDERGHFLSQRTQPKMAQLAVSLDGQLLRISASALSVDVPRRPESGEPRTVEVWGDEMPAWSLGREPAAALSQFLGVDCELVYMPDHSVRPVDPDFAPAGLRVGFADGFPFLLASEASLAELGRRGAPVEMIRFRPNLVVDGTTPFAEDGWRELAIGGVRFVAVKPCARCAIPNVDPSTGEVGIEPTRTLVGFRKLEGKVLFGQNLVALGRGVVRVGDAVELR